MARRGRGHDHYLVFPRLPVRLGPQPVALAGREGQLADLDARLADTGGVGPGALVPYPLERVFARVMLAWEPVSGFEPLTCRLQDGCSAN